MLKKLKKIVFVFVLVASYAIFSSPALFAAIPEPKSGGKYTLSKGTKAEESYEKEGRAGGTGYEWGKGIQFFNALIKPFVQYMGQWEDNIFFVSSDKQSDYINRLSAGLEADLPLNGGQHLLTGKYLTDSEWYNKHSDQDHTDHTFGGSLELNFVPFSLDLEDYHRRTVDRADTEFTSRVARDENVASALLEIPFSSFFLETESLNSNVNYRHPENEPFNHNDFTVFQRVGVEITPATQVLAEYGYEYVYYPKSEGRDGNANQAMLGLRGIFSERLTYQAWGGAQWRVYDENSRPDFHGAVVRAAAQYDITEKSYMVLKFNRDPQESTFDDQSFYVRNKSSLAWRQQIAERVFILADGAVSYNEYSRISVIGTQERTRRDYVWESGIGLQYLMPNDMISIFGEYRHRQRASNLDGFDYDDNTVNFGIKSSF